MDTEIGEWGEWLWVNSSLHLGIAEFSGLETVADTYTGGGFRFRFRNPLGALSEIFKSSNAWQTIRYVRFGLIAVAVEEHGVFPLFSSIRKKGTICSKPLQEPIVRPEKVSTTYCSAAPLYCPLLPGPRLAYGTRASWTDCSSIRTRRHESRFGKLRWIPLLKD